MSSRKADQAYACGVAYLQGFREITLSDETQIYFVIGVSTSFLTLSLSAAMVTTEERDRGENVKGLAATRFVLESICFCSIIITT